MDQEITVRRGDLVRCNRCDRASAWPKSDAIAVRENSRAYRIQKMAVLDCGHMDAHWIYESDRRTEG